MKDALSHLKIPASTHKRLKFLIKSKAGGTKARKLMYYAFWIYFSVKYKYRSNDDRLREMRAKVKEKYVELFLYIEKPKEDIIQILPFWVGQAVVKLFQR